MSELETRYRGILDRVAAACARAGRSVEDVTLIAVSKTQSADQVEALYRLGHRDFGENYAQELSAKAQELEARGCKEIRWHFIGHLQTNKIKFILPWIHALHTVDTEKLGFELARRWRDSGRAGKLPAFVEVNVDNEESKAGVTPQVAKDFTLGLVEKFPELEFQGLMCIPAAHETKSEIRRPFTLLRSLEESCRPHTRGKLSMGMSGDFEIAVEEGATHVRVGTAIFGARPPKGG